MEIKVADGVRFMNKYEEKQQFLMRNSRTLDDVLVRFLPPCNLFKPIQANVCIHSLKSDNVQMPLGYWAVRPGPDSRITQLITIIIYYLYYNIRNM